jgi:hypothetical protein
MSPRTSIFIGLEKMCFWNGFFSLKVSKFLAWTDDARLVLQGQQRRIEENDTEKFPPCHNVNFCPVGHRGHSVDDVEVDLFADLRKI